MSSVKAGSSKQPGRNWRWNWKKKAMTGSNPKNKQQPEPIMKAEQQYTELFTEHETLIRQHSSAIQNRLRTQALEDFRRLGFPSVQSEDYKHTDVAKAFAFDYGINLKRINIPANPHDVFRCDVPHLSTFLYFVVNDSFYDKEQPEAGLPGGAYAGGLNHFAERYPEIAGRCYGRAASAGKDGIIALNTMLAQDGFVLYVPEGVVVERPVQLIQIFRSDVDTMASRRILVIMEPRSQARLLVCDHSIGRVKFLSTEVIEIFAGEGASFDYYDMEESSEQTARFASLHVKQEASSNVLVNGITLNNGLTRNNYYIELNGEYAESTLCGMSILDREQQVDTFTHITHAVPNCTSNELFKNLLNGRSTGVFSGRILVKEGAQKTSAYQTNRNLCTAREARMYGKPQLEIYADDVRCSHGMTTGQLDENALFYLRSRGIPEDEALTMLSIAFTADVLDNVRLDGLKGRLHTLIEKRLHGELAQCAECHNCL
jgi:Fe-S cluster assembly protein SufD